MKKYKLIKNSIGDSLKIETEVQSLREINIYEDGKIIVEIQNGWLETPYNNSFKEIIFNTEIKKRKKIDLYKKEIFYVQPYSIFIHKDFLKNLHIKKKTKINEDELGTKFCDIVSFDVEGLKENKNNDDYQKETFNVKTNINYIYEKKPFGVKCQNIANIAYKMGVNISIFDVQKLLTKFNIEEIK